MIEIFTPGTAEFEPLWRFNYAVFAAELGMREVREDRTLVDKFHAKNIYFAARLAAGGEIVGMISAHWQPPYSAAEHFGEAVTAMPAGGKLAEIRLFAVRADFRGTSVPARLGIAMLTELGRRKIDEVVISGISTQKPLYEQLGFAVAGTPAASGQTTLYPMRARLGDVLRRCRCLERYL